MSTAEVVFCKLGGSLITEKRRPRTLRAEVLARLCDEIAAALPSLAEAGQHLILGHGSGSFGHVAAAEHGLAGVGAAHEGASATGNLAFGASYTQAIAAELNRYVCDALRDAGVAPFTVAPSTAIVAADGESVGFDPEAVMLALAAGLLPVVYGDVVVDRVRGASICSTETALVSLAASLRAEGRNVARAIWLGETDGVYDNDGVTMPEIPVADDVVSTLAGASGTDVTGGIVHRVSAARELALGGTRCLIANGMIPGLLGAALRGEAAPGTRIEAGG